MKKTIYLALFALIAMGILFFFVIDVNRIAPSDKTAEVQEETQQVDVERDEQGCLVPAGYRYSEEIGACIRDWELDQTQKIVAAKAVETLLGRDSGLTIIDVFRGEEDNAYIVNIQRPNTEQISVRVEDEQTDVGTDGTDDISDEILTALIEKNDWEEDVDLTVTVKSNDKEFAFGGVGAEYRGPGGGIWYAANIDGGWEIIWDGNGAIYCSDIESFETEYEITVPSDLIGICYDESQNIEINR